jgi:UDP-3-O-[3-hydroxymyristoyl] glucosamine N-acyltransferase
MFGGQTGVIGHIHIPDGTKLGAKAGVQSAVNVPNQAWQGSPAMPYMTFMKSSAIIRKLPELQKRINELEKEVLKLKSK